MWEVTLNSMERLKGLIRRFDVGFLIVTAIAFIAIWPFISRSSLPVETDAELHIFRLHELGLLVRGGDFYPRWAPNFYHGYGYPIFNYYAPLSYYVGLIFELMPPFDAVAAVKGVFIIGLLAAALGTYGFVRDNWGRGAGYVAAALYVYAPYVQYVDPQARGVLAEAFSLGVFPLVLWALDRLRKGGGWRVWVTAVFLTSAVILSHNLMALLFFGLLSAWAGWQLLLAFGQAGQLHPKKNIGLVFAALALGLGAAAFFWLPVYLEREAVNLSTLLGQGDNYDFHTHFLSMREMLSFSTRLDWGASEPAFRFNLGIMQWVLALFGILMASLRRVRDGWHVFFFIAGLGGLVLLMLPLSAPVWEALPFLPFFQFPWRLLGPAAALSALIGGAGVSALTSMMAARPKVAAGVTAVLTVLPILFGLPLSQPAPWADFGEVNTLRLTLIENTGRWLGTTSTADYVPTTVDVIPARKGRVVGGIVDGLPMDRVNYDMLPDEATIETRHIRPLYTQYEMYTPRDTRLRLYQFAFPGWEVRIDGEVVETELARPDGFMVIPVPAGHHIIDVVFRNSLPRQIANGVTLISLLLTAVVGVILIVRRRRPAAGSAWQVSSAARKETDWWTLAAVMIVTLLTIFVLEPTAVLRYDSSGFVAEPAQRDLFADFGEQIALIGYTTAGETAVAGDLLRIDLYWQAEDELDINYQVFLHVLQPDGRLVTQSHKLNPGEFPTKRWPTDKYIRDTHFIRLPEETAAGEYVVSTGLWVQSEGWRLPLLEDSVQIGDHVDLFTLTVEAE